METGLAVATSELRRPRGEGDLSRADHAYLALREDIITAELPPGTVLREEDLMRRVGTGRTPVREAIQQLIRDGFVTVMPRRGTFVSAIHITDLAAIYEVRIHLESWEARLAAERLTPQERATAESLIAELDALTVEDGHEPLLALDRRIHRFVYSCGKNDYLAETLDQYHNLSLRIIYFAMKRYPALTPSLDQVVHDQRALLDALCRGEGDEAERIARQHVIKFEAAVRALI
jgi:DNA-binding GntR family transcriptional regulator